MVTPIEKTTMSVTVDPVTKLEILPCPFCGGTASVEEFSNAHVGVSYSVGCDTDGDGTCYGYQSLTSFDRRSNAINAWNKRAPIQR